METKKTAIKSSLLLFLAACIWGFAFVAQSIGMEHMGPFTFNGVRFLMGGIVLLPIMLVRSKKKREEKEREGKKQAEEKKSFTEATIRGGLYCGAALCAASLLQQVGIQYTTVGKAGFITTLYIIIVPVLGLFLHKKVQGKVWIAAAVAVFGLYTLCVNEYFSIGQGDFLIFISALLFSIHILLIDYFSPKVDGVALSCIQFFVAGVISTMGGFIFEQPSWEQLVSGIWPLLYAGVMSCGVAYTLQIIGQRKVEPTVASLVLSMESVISVLAGWVILKQALSAKELFGCMLVFLAVVLVQLPEQSLKRDHVRGEAD